MEATFDLGGTVVHPHIVGDTAYLTKPGLSDHIRILVGLRTIRGSLTERSLRRE